MDNTPTTKENLLKFHTKVVEKYKKGEYKKKYNTDIIEKDSEFNIIGQESLYALNYMIYEYCVANNEQYLLRRITSIILIPVGSMEKMEKISLKKYKINFALCDFETFYEFMIEIKD